MQFKSDKKFGLLKKFILMFSVFVTVTLILIFIFTYFNQMNSYRFEQEVRIKQLAEYLSQVITADGNNFVWYQDYFLKHTKDIRIPHDFGTAERDGAAKRWNMMFTKAYPGKTLGIDVDFDDMDDKMKEAFALYYHMYYLLLFEQAVETFGVKYTYYITPFGDEPYSMCYILDAVREELTEDGKSYILVTDEIYEAPEKFPLMWDTWNTGEKLSGFDIFDNEYGHTYTYYFPLYIHDVKMGLICVDVEIESVRHDVLMQTFGQMFYIWLILMAVVGLLLWFINNQYIARIEALSDSVREYSVNKDTGIVSKIRKYDTFHDEIAFLSDQVASMVIELDRYMKDMVANVRELYETRIALAETVAKAEKITEKAMKDNLTGVGNKNAYEEMKRKMEIDMMQFDVVFGVVMIDLNFLKKINDTYGHDKGDISIQILSDMVCDVFTHSPVYRVGGDEFVVVVMNRDYRQVSRLIDDLKSKIVDNQYKSLEPYEQISAAVGYAEYDRTVDMDFDSVFKRADKMMYEDKKQMKAVRSI